MKFTPIEIKTWPRGQMFYYFSKMAPTSYSITVEVDVTDFLETLKTAQRKFFPDIVMVGDKMSEQTARVQNCISRRNFRILRQTDSAL